MFAADRRDLQRHPVCVWRLQWRAENRAALHAKRARYTGKFASPFFVTPCVQAFGATLGNFFCAWSGPFVDRFGARWTIIVGSTINFLGGRSFYRFRSSFVVMALFACRLLLALAVRIALHFCRLVCQLLFFVSPRSRRRLV